MTQAIIIFDGVCNFCNASINFIIKHDHEAYFRFATTQSQFGSKQLLKLGIDPLDPTTFVYIEGQKWYLKSDAALEIATHLVAPWSGLATLKYVPRFIRNPMYSLIANNRYRLLGKRDSCMIPSAELKARFLD